MTNFITGSVIRTLQYSICAAKTKTGKSNPFVVILVTVLVTVLLIAVGYFACLKAGLIAPPREPCCFGVLELDFDFNAQTRGA